MSSVGHHPSDCSCKLCCSKQGTAATVYTPLTLLPVENRKTLGRDPYSKAIVNNDVVGLAKAREMKQRMAKKIEDEKIQKEKINNLEAEVDTIKSMLSEVLEILKSK